MEETPSSRQCLVIAVETAPIERKPGFSIIPDHTSLMDVVSSLLSVLFGKKIEQHGFIESNGFFNYPDFSSFNTLCDPRLPYTNHKPRNSVSIELELDHFSKINKILRSYETDETFFNHYTTAASFYRNALCTVDRQPELAYLNLITAGEVISNYFAFPKQDLLDDQARKVLNQIESTAQDGQKLVRFIKGRLYQVKRGFVKTFEELINDNFFNSGESVQPFGNLKKEDLSYHIAAAYDLRSKYVHSGIPFGKWVVLGAGSRNDEKQLGTPMVADREYQKVLSKAPTFVGLERILRFALLKLAQTKGDSIHEDLVQAPNPSLNSDPTATTP